MGTSDLNDNREKKEINLRDYWAVILKRKWAVILFALAVLAAVGIKSFLTKPTYTAKGTLLIEKEPNILSFEDIFQIETFNDDYFQTQYKLLQTRAVASDTIERLKLYENEKFMGLSVKGGADLYKTDSEFRESLISHFLGGLEIIPVRQTRLVEVYFSAGDAQLAADALNALFDSFIDMNVQKKFHATEQATQFLSDQIANIRAEIEEKEKKLGEYGAEKNIITLSDEETTIVEKLGEFNRALTEAQLDRVNKETYYNEIRMASPDYIPDALTNPLIQALREDYARLTREYLKKSETFKPEYPEMQGLKTELDSAKESLQNETQNLIKGAYSDYQAALRREQSLEGVFNKQKREAILLNSNAILYNSLKIEMQNSKNLLDTLLKRQSETGVSARLKGLGTSNIWVVDRAAAPLYPSSPKKKLNILLGLMVGLFGGIGLAFVLDYLDNSVRNFQDLEKYGGLSSLGIVPAISQDGYENLGFVAAKAKRIRSPEHEAKSDYGKSLFGEENKKENGLREEEAATDIPEAGSFELIAHTLPMSNIAENFRSIRTTLLLSAADMKPKCFLVTSSLAQEGKTSTLSNLAITLAQAGKRVLIIDADLRKPRLHKIFKIKNVNGVTNYLSAQTDLKELEKATRVPNLYLINSGPVPPNPVELLASERMGNLIDVMRERFDYVLFDSPPLLPVSDAVVLGPKIDAAILVVWGGKTTRDTLRRAKEKLSVHRIKCAGAILNRISLEDHDYYYMKHYYRYYGK